MERKTILIADDEIVNLQTLVRFLNEGDEKYNVLRVVNGKLAYEVAVKELPDLVITDWNMPVMNGIDLTKKLKANNSTHDIPVIMCTGAMTSPENLKTALEAGASDYIRKPLEKIELLARVRSMLELSGSYKTIKQLSSNKDMILSIVSHDLRGPVGNLYAMIDALLSDKFPESRKELFLKTAKSSIGATYNMLENLLSWANIQRNNIGCNPQKTSVCELVEENITLLSENIKQKSLYVESNVDKHIFAFADQAMLNTVIRNIISNAIKFTEKGGKITIDAFIEPKIVKIEIADTGVGISDDNISKILNPNDHFTTRGTSYEKGAGIGLQLSQKLIEKNMGKIDVKSTVGEGTVFSFTVPSYTADTVS